MSDEDIVTKAIKKAIEGGWQEPDDEYLSSVIFAYGGWGDMESLGNQYEQWCGFMDARGLKDIIFDHEFAKALWRKGNTFKHKDGTLIVIKNPNLWRAKLRSMVVAKDPIQYLGEHI